MTNVSLAQSYLSKARVRLTILPVLLDAAAYSDVVRGAQEVVELALKGMLRQAGIEPPHWHDVGGLVREYADRFARVSADDIERLAAISAWPPQPSPPDGHAARFITSSRNCPVRPEKDATSTLAATTRELWSNQR